jgi:hypothetical protein
MPSRFDDFGLITAYKDGGGWWYATHQWDSDRLRLHKLVRCAFDTLPEYVRERLAILMPADIGFSMDDVGKRVDEKSYWLYVSKKEVEDEQNKSV